VPSSVNAFSRGAARYARDARLQQAVAWRLAHLCRDLSLGPGPVLDLGAGSGNLSLALEQQRIGVHPLLVDNCPALLAEAGFPPERKTLWDLNLGLPPGAAGASLLLSSFALHWLRQPAQQLRHWAEALAPCGWLGVAVPVEGSLSSWHHAATAAGVRCSALLLPKTEELLAGLADKTSIERQLLLSFSCRYERPLAFLRELRHLGVNGGARHQPGPGELRQLLRHWPLAADGSAIVRWRLLFVLARRR
jgi:malonyl-CoA O-methyltransferase